MLRVVRTENGMVEGLPAADPRITAFKGIPFAAPPVGKNRWRAPQPCEDWEGTLKAYQFAPISVQDTPGLGTDVYCKEWHVDPKIPMGEDCLYLNVWTGAKKTDEKRPVLVWYFGGALQWGYPAEMEFDGERLARRGIVVVTVNYRINVFGFLAHPEITAEQPDTPSNFGNLDQQAGLKWVLRNIGAFGGDPDNITIAGQSAGGGSVMSQLACRDNDGLFQKAIVESALIRDPYTGFGIGHPTPLAEAEQMGREFFEFLGAATLKEARKLDAFYIRDKYAEYAKDHRRMMTVEDGKFCVGDPIDLFAEGKCVRVPVMSGNTADEFPNALIGASEGEIRSKAGELFGEDAERFLALAQAEDRKAQTPFGSGIGKVSGIECLAKALFLQNEKLGIKEPCYYYRFDTDIPGEDDPGTFHSVDLWFFFETLAKCWRPFVGRHYDLARQMCNYWSNFIKTGDPNGFDADGTSLPEWRPYTKEDPCSMVFGRDGAFTQTEDGELEKLMIDLNRKKFQDRIDRFHTEQIDCF